MHLLDERFVFGGDERSFLKEEVKTYLRASMFFFFFLTRQKKKKTTLIPIHSRSKNVIFILFLSHSYAFKAKTAQFLLEIWNMQKGKWVWPKG